MAGDWFATFAILAWPLVALGLYKTRPASEATLWTVLGGLLFLPANTAIKLEMIPALDKNSMPNLCVLAGWIVFASARPALRTGFGIIGILAVAWIAGPVITSISNGDTLVYGTTVLPGVGYYDGISALLSQALLCLPFFIGRQMLYRPADGEAIMRILVISGLIYTFPMLFEIKMSPVISNWVYGFLSSGFSTEMRYGGFRPVVFMKNGLTAAFFLMTSFVAALTFLRLRERIVRWPTGPISFYLVAVLVLCKSAGALVYAVMAGGLVKWTKPRFQLRVAAILVSIGLLYPLLRITNNFPTTELLSIASSVNDERAQSLGVRFSQEDRLLAHASERFTFGWGRYGRNRLYDDYGKDVSITDGAWIQILGQFGLVGFVAQFGLLALPVFRAISAARFVRSERDLILMASLALIVALDLVEQIPNSSMSSWNWLLAGALLGQAEYVRAMAQRSKKPARYAPTSGSPRIAAG